MELITVLSDGERSIAYEEIVQLFEDWADGVSSDSVRATRRDNWGDAKYCIVDHQDAEQAVSASNAIRAFLPQVPIIMITDFTSKIRKCHLQQIKGTGLVKMMLWNEQQPGLLINEMERWLYTTDYQQQLAIPQSAHRI